MRVLSIKLALSRGMAAIGIAAPLLLLGCSVGQAPSTPPPVISPASEQAQAEVTRAVAPATEQTHDPTATPLPQEAAASPTATAPAPTKPPPTATPSVPPVAPATKSIAPDASPTSAAAPAGNASLATPAGTRASQSAGAIAQAQPTVVGGANVSGPPANTVLSRQNGAELAEGTLQGTVLANNQIQLARQTNGSFVSDGTLLSAEHEAQMPFDNAVLSWNAKAPGGTALRFELRVRVGSTWTPWYVMGTWGATGGASKSGQSDGWATVDVDTLKLHQPAGAWQYRVTLTTQDAAATPSLQRVALVYADLRRPLAGTPPQPAPGWARDLAVPAYSQLTEDPAIAREICSATSLTMILDYYGANKKVSEVVQGVRDQTTGIFGNWPLNTAYAGALGMEAFVDRFYAIEQVEDEIAHGRPVAMSIKFQPGELSGAPISSTTGHLIVVRGFTPEGNVIVNDPIAPNPASVRRVYNRQQLESIWLKAGGVVYLVRPPSQ